MAVPGRVRGAVTIYEAFLRGDISLAKVQAWQKQQSPGGATFTTTDEALDAIQGFFQNYNLGALFKKDLTIGANNGTWTQNNVPSSLAAIIKAAGDGGGGNGNGSGSGGISPETIANNAATFRVMVQSLQMKPNANINNLIATASQNGWSTDRFQLALFKTPEFHQEYAGIYNKNGTLKMSPSEYLSAVSQYKDYAAHFGIPMNNKMISYLFKNNVSPSEFSERAQADQRLRDNADMFQAFNEQRKVNGEKPLTRKDMYKMVMGEGDAKWYQDWNQAVTRNAAQEAGITFDKQKNPMADDTVLNVKTIKQITGKDMSEADLQQHYSNLVSTLQSAMPLSRIQKFGLTKDDLVQAEFGGPRAADVRAQITQIMQNEQAFQQGGVQTQIAGIGSRAGNRPQS